ncbi:hypothetical protein ABPG74_010886 [Tetrahymena malaccensis]
MKSRINLKLLLILIGIAVSLGKDGMSHEHGNQKRQNYKQINHKSYNQASEDQANEKKSYTPTELLKEQYEVRNKFKKICGDFDLSDDEQWPVSEIDASQIAQSMFAFNLKDPRDIYDIIVNQKEIDTIYWTQIIAKLQPWIIMILVCLIGQCICCCQIFCIPELKIFRRCCQIDFNKETESNWEKNIYFFLIVIFGGLIFFIGGCIFMSSDFDISQNQFQCTVLWSQKVLLGVDKQNQTAFYESSDFDEHRIQNTSDIYKLNFQDDEESDNFNNSNSTWVANYGGVDVIKHQFQQMIDFFKTIQDKESAQQIKEIQVNPFYDEYNTVQSMIPQLYEKHKGKQLVNPNSIDQVSYMNNQFIEQIGPLQTIGTIGWLLSNEIKSRKFKIDFISEVQKHSSHLEEVRGEISSTALEAKNEIDNITYLANIYLKKVDYLIDQYKPFVTQGVDYIEKYFEVVMFMVFCGLVGFIFVAWPKFNSCAILLHFSWYCSTCVLIVGLALCLIMFSIGVILNNGICKASEDFLTNPNFFKAEHIDVSQQLKNSVNYCIFHNNKTYFEVQKYLQEVEVLEKALDAFLNLNLSKQSLNSKINYVQNVLDNEKNASPVAANEANKNLNDWTDFSIKSSLQLSEGQCSISRDQWIWQDSECPYSTIIDSKQPDFDLGFTVCLRIIKTNPDFVNQRYSDQFKHCKASVEQEIVKRFNAIQNYRNSVKDVFSGVLNDLNDYNTQVDKLDIDIDKISAKLKNFNKEFDQIFEVVTSVNGGLQQTLDCNFVKDTIIRAKNSICITGLNGVFLYTVFFLASSVFLVFFSLFVCISAARILPNKDEEIQKQMMLSTLNQNSSFVLNTQRAQYNPNESSYIYRKDQKKEQNSPNNSYELGIQYKVNKNSNVNNNVISSDQENQHQSNQQIHQQNLKESDNSFMKKTKNQLRDINENENDSDSYHSAQNHF